MVRRTRKTIKNKYTDDIFAGDSPFMNHLIAFQISQWIAEKILEGLGEEPSPVTSFTIANEIYKPIEQALNNSDEEKPQ